MMMEFIGRGADCVVVTYRLLFLHFAHNIDHQLKSRRFVMWQVGTMANYVDAKRVCCTLESRYSLAFILVSLLFMLVSRARNCARG